MMVKTNKLIPKRKEEWKKIAESTIPLAQESVLKIHSMDFVTVQEFVRIMVVEITTIVLVGNLLPKVGVVVEVIIGFL